MAVTKERMRVCSPNVEVILHCPQVHIASGSHRLNPSISALYGEDNLFCTRHYLSKKFPSKRVERPSIRISCFCGLQANSGPGGA